MTKILMLASFGLEIVECGGALARHIQAGDSVHATVLLSKPDIVIHQDPATPSTTWTRIAA